MDLNKKEDRLHLMDMVDHSADRFAEIRQTYTDFLGKVGVKHALAGRSAG